MLTPRYTCPICNRACAAIKNRFGDLLLTKHKARTWGTMHGKRSPNYGDSEDNSDLEMLAIERECTGSGTWVANVNAAGTEI